MIRRKEIIETYVFDIRAGMDGDDVAVLDSEIVSNDPVDTGTSVVKIIIGQNNQHGVLALFSFYQHGIASEEL